MFTGIVEGLGTIVKLQKNEGNLHIFVRSHFSHELHVDQSVSHNGVCLTVTGIDDGIHNVVAIEETMAKTNIGQLKEGDEVNLERCTKVGDRLDGHIVQGHVDQTAECISVEEQNGSWLYTFRYKPNRENLIVEKGSICLNGISLTAFNAKDDLFSVAIIPYTYQFTNIKHLQKSSIVNLEFDIIGKYVSRLVAFGK